MHLLAQGTVVLAGIVVPTGRIDEDLRVSLPALHIRQQPEERLALDLGNGIPHRHVDRANRDRTLAVAAGLFILHHRRPDPVRIEIGAGIIHEAFRRRFQNTIPEAFADKAALAITAIGVEAVANHAPPVSHDIGDDGHQARRHLAEVDIGVADRRRDRLRHFADIDDTHGSLPVRI